MKLSWMRRIQTMAAASVLAAAAGLCLGGCSAPADNKEATAATEAVIQSSETEREASGSEDTGDGEKLPPKTAIEMTRRMGNGINLGNTMEAYGHTDLGVGRAVSEYETHWGQPVTTEEMVKAMKDMGFDSLRIPVAWTNAMDFENGDYTIGQDYMDRIEELVGYGLDNGMAVIINDHWDGGWWGMFGSSSEDTRQKAMEMYTAIWEQITERFKDYPMDLIFESGNEELGDRLNDVDLCEDSGALSEDECYETANRINQTFVDLVRKSGGNNAERFLLIAGYNTDIDKTCDERYVMPEDTAENKLMVSVHYYMPWGYCGTAGVSQWGSAGEYKEQNDTLEKMTKFTKQGYGVVIGEYAVALNEDGLVKDNTAAFIENFLNNCDEKDFCPMLWDCSNLFLRDKLSFLDEASEQVYRSHSEKAREGMTRDEIAEQAREKLKAALAAAPEALDLNVDVSKLDGATAWIMFSSSDGKLEYSVGDIYKPGSKTDGIVAEDAEIDGEGDYIVKLDVTGASVGSAAGVGFSALGIATGEILYPGYVITIQEIRINGEKYEPDAESYTTSDNGICTRVNLYNRWASFNPEESRVANKETGEASPVVIGEEAWKGMKTLEITFHYGPME